MSASSGSFRNTGAGASSARDRRASTHVNNRSQPLEPTFHATKEAGMKMIRIGMVLLVGTFALGGATTLRAATMTLEGAVADAKCGAKHMMKDAAACTKACVDKGSDYALVVGDKVYTLKTSSDKEKT